jgi:hypothetical protein
MQRSTKIGLTILGLVIIISWLAIIFPFFRDAHIWRSQMKAGQKYMDSLTEKDIPVWINRTKMYLDEFRTNANKIQAEPIPSDLQQLKISGIYCEESNLISYVWMSGFDHTSLNVEHMANGEFRFTAIYYDESNRVIWPKSAEH